MNVYQEAIAGRIQRYLRQHPELRNKRYASDEGGLAGHCYVASEAMRYFFPESFSACYLRYEGGTHWYLENLFDGEVVDLTVEQFDFTPDYSLGVGCGFLTRDPSKRAWQVIQAVGGRDDPVPG
jgi:hypothetical protein